MCCVAFNRRTSNPVHMFPGVLVSRETRSIQREAVAVPRETEAVDHSPVRPFKMNTRVNAVGESSLLTVDVSR